MNQDSGISMQEMAWLTEGIQNPFAKIMPPILKGLLKRLLCLPELQDLYRRTRSQSQSKPFWDSLLGVLGVSYQVDEGDRRRIPATGPLIVVANHPFGAIEGLAMASVLCSVRSDVKILANSILEPIEELRDLFIYVDSFGGSGAARRNIQPLRNAMRWLKCGGVLATFPAGEVAHIHLKHAAITDPNWKDTVGRIARSLELPVLPIYFRGINSPLFQILGLLHPKVRTAMLVREMLNKKNCSFEVRIGTLIPLRRLKAFSTDQETTAYLRKRTFLLEHREDKKAAPFGRLRSLNSPLGSQAPIVAVDRPDIMEAEIDGLESENILIHQREILVAHASAWQIPSVLREIGRQREIAFRAVGEGSGKEIALDIYDEHYQHIFLWNRAKREIAGAYRVGRTDLILRKSGLNGLYVHALFRLRREFFGKMGPALELGRSFIRLEYQRDNRSLPLLWEGIGRYVARHPKYRYLYGPVSISNDYRPMSRQLIAWFLRENYSGETRPFDISPVKPPSFGGNAARAAQEYCASVRNLDELSDIISEIEPDSKGVPVLLRHYIRLGAKVLAFNVDPHFGNCLDALALIDLAQAESKILERLMGKTASVNFRLYHGTSIHSIRTLLVHRYDELH